MRARTEIFKFSVRTTASLNLRRSGILSYHDLYNGVRALLAPRLEKAESLDRVSGLMKANSLGGRNTLSFASPPTSPRHKQTREIWR